MPKLVNELLFEMNGGAKQLMKLSSGATRSPGNVKPKKASQKAPKKKVEKSPEKPKRSKSN